MYPMINEGARILEEKIAARPSDIDVIWLYGYGWPIYRGGPMFYADQVGLKHFADRLSLYARETTIPRWSRRRCSSGWPRKARPLRRWRGRRRPDGDVPVTSMLRPSPCGEGDCGLRDPHVRGYHSADSRLSPPAAGMPRRTEAPFNGARMTPPGEQFYPRRLPLGRTDRARDAARSAVEGRRRLRRPAGDRIPRPPDQLCRAGRQGRGCGVGIPARRLRPEHFGGAVPRQFAGSSGQFLRRAESRRPRRASFPARRRARAVA